MTDAAYTSKFPPVYVTVDVVLLTIRDKQLHVLMVERGSHPWRGSLALPGGFLRQDEHLADGARRELREETGVEGRLGAKLGDVRYVYTWDGERVFKVVSFFLAYARRGRVGVLPPGMEVEIAEARWLPLDDGARLLAYRGERDMAARALDGLGSDPVGSDPI